MTQKCGSVAIIGVANAGKSTLVNQIVGSKVAIVSPKPQTTRQRLMGITCHQDTQLLLIDTPGLFNPRKRIEKAMVKSARQSASEADIRLLLIDCRRKLNEQIKLIESLDAPLLVALNKIDAVEKDTLLKIASELSSYHTIERVFMISALTGDGVSNLTEYLYSLCPEGTWLFDEDQLMDWPLKLWAAEITREQIMLQLHEEIPYATYVETEQWEHMDNGGILVHQRIVVDRASHKGIVIGKGGQRLKAIGMASRQILTEELGQPVHLKLFVKVEPNWMDRADFYRFMGYEEI